MRKQKLSVKLCAIFKLRIWARRHVKDLGPVLGVAAESFQCIIQEQIKFFIIKNIDFLYKIFRDLSRSVLQFCDYICLAVSENWKRLKLKVLNCPVQSLEILSWKFHAPIRITLSKKKSFKVLSHYSAVLKQLVKINKF